MTDPRIGILATDKVRTVWPEVTLSGQRYEKNGAIRRTIDNQHFVVLDTFPAVDFDAEAAITTVLATLQPVEPESTPESVEVKGKSK